MPEIPVTGVSVVQGHGVTMQKTCARRSEILVCLECVVQGRGACKLTVFAMKYLVGATLAHVVVEVCATPWRTYATKSVTIQQPHVAIRSRAKIHILVTTATMVAGQAVG